VLREPRDGRLDIGQRYRAHVAEILRDDSIGGDLLEKRGVDVVHRERLPDDIADRAVDREAGRRRQHLRLRQHREPDDIVWPVALVRDSHQIAPRAERADNLGRGWQERDDTGHASNPCTKSAGRAMADASEGPSYPP